jgi:hypothetical protein
MSKVLHVEIKDLSVSSNKGTPVIEAAQLGTLYTLGQLNQLAEKYLGKTFEKGTKKPDACAKLFTAMTAALPVENKPAIAKAKKATSSYTAPEAENGMADVPTPDGVQTVEKPPKVAKAPKVPKEPKEPKKYTFISLGKGVKGADVKYNEKPLARQGQLLYDAFAAGLDKGKKVELTKEEILEKIDAIPEYGAGNHWTNFAWYRNMFKKIGCME